MKNQNVNTQNKTAHFSKKDIRAYNEEIHVGTGLTGDDLYTLDESEDTDFIQWRNKRNNTKEEGKFTQGEWSLEATLLVIVPLF